MGLDALGALTTFLLLSQLVARYADFFGLPAWVIWFLALLAALFFLYSAAVYLRLRGKAVRPWLRGIAIANQGYCLLSLLVLFYFQPSFWAWLYFGGEILVVFTLARLEWRAARA